MDIKPFKTISEQIDILKQKKLIINDEKAAANILAHINYYRLSGYTLTLRKNDRFYNNVSFEQVMQIYNFDAELRAVLLYALEYIEVSFRTYIGYYHSKKYGPLGYLDKSTFADEKRCDEFHEEVRQLIESNERNELFIKHHKEKYNSHFPMWVIVEIMQFGCLSRLFKNLDEELKKEICTTFYSPIPYTYIENWLQAFVVLRNICAHRGRIYNRYITFTPKLSKKDKELFRRNNLDLSKAGKQLFTFIFVMNKVIDDNVVWNNFINKIDTLIKKYPFVKISFCGFPENWWNILYRS